MLLIHNFISFILKPDCSSREMTPVLLMSGFSSIILSNRIRERISDASRKFSTSVALVMLETS